MSDVIAPANLFECAVDAWDWDGAKLVLGELLTGISLANEIIEPPQPVDGLQINIRPFPWSDRSLIKGLHTGWASVGFALDATAYPFLLAGKITSVAIHEVTHVARHQHMTAQRDSSQGTLFGDVLHEGIAVRNQQDLCGLDYSADFSIVIEHEEKNEVELAAQDLAQGFRPNAECTDEVLHSYLFGTDSLPNKGYKVGLYIANTLIAQGLSHEELIKMPTQTAVNYFREAV